jgi:hypothetical protein
MAALSLARRGDGSSLLLRSELANTLDQRSVIAPRAGGSMAAFAEKACAEQVGQCKMDNERAGWRPHQR